MNKNQLIDALASRFDGNRRVARHALESVLDTITREVARGEKVAITGFGSFERQLRKARMVRNPRTGESVKAKSTHVPKFKAGQDLKNVVSGAKKLPKLTLDTAAPGGRVAAATSPAKRTTTKKTTAKKSTAKSTSTRSAATKSTAKKTATKSAAKKAPAKKTATRSAAKTAPAKKTATKSAAKKAPATRSAAKKAPATRSSATSTAKKTAAKKAPAKKSTAKKTPAKRAAKKS